MPEFESVQFIGDPHVSSRRPGRRSDDYARSVIAKLEECASVSHAQRAFTVVLGDLFHRADESDLALLTRLSRVLRSFYAPVLVLVGNHDHKDFSLTDGDALRFFLENGVIQALGSQLVELGTLRLRLVGVNYGEALPDEVSREGADTVCLVTHHDLAFGSAYPGALPLKPIAGADFVVNGHMHDTKPSETVGSTVWHNPGNIEPLSIDMRGHQPACWLYRPAAEEHALERVLLVHDFDCFDLTGLTVEAADALSSVQALQLPGTPARFATQLACQDTMAADRTDDMSILEEDLGEVLGASSVSEGTQALLKGLLERVRELS